ncbi:MAG: AMP-dependent synthetase [Spirochaetales bacterium]|nr:MAG: AMP-dependent synthetase [Spirochaetales bacterium]
MADTSRKDSPSLIHHFLERSAALFPDQIAVVHEKNRVEYARLNRTANQLAHCLLQDGIREGDRVAFLSENSLDYIVCYYGILKAGGMAVALNTELKPEGYAELLRELEPAVLIVSRKFEAAVHSLDLSPLRIRRLYVIHPRLSLPPAGGTMRSFTEALSGQPEHNPELNMSPQACANIIYTSGTAKKPRGVMLSHANIIANTRAIVAYLELTSKDVQMVVLPFFYVMGLSLLNTHIAVGGRIVINNQFAYTASVLKQMKDEGVTGFSGVPSTYAHLVFKSPLARYRDQLPELRYCSQAGGHMPRSIKRELLEQLPPQTRLFVMYGATEASARLTYVPPAALKSKIDSIGKPIAGVEIIIRSPDGEALKQGETGELVARGDNIMLGYYKDPSATAAVLDQNGYHTGDFGYYDDEGFLFLVGRRDRQVKVGGHRINPQEIEDVIIESGRASECLVFGLADSSSDDRLTGLVVPLGETGDAVSAILRYCAVRLPKYKIPTSLQIVAAIPHNSSGKPDLARGLEIYEELMPAPPKR